MSEPMTKEDILVIIAGVKERLAYPDTDERRLWTVKASTDIRWLVDLVEQLQSELAAAQKLCEIYFNVAAAAVGEDAVREARDSEIAWDKAIASTTPEQAGKIRARIREQLIDAMIRDTKMNDDPARIEADFAAVDMAAPGTSDYTESVKRLQAPVLTMDQALRIVDAIGPYPITVADLEAIQSRIEELGDSDAKMRPSEAVRLARAEFVLRVVNEGGRE